MLQKIYTGVENGNLAIINTNHFLLGLVLSLRIIIAFGFYIQDRPIIVTEILRENIDPSETVKYVESKWYALYHKPIKYYSANNMNDLSVYFKDKPHVLTFGDMTISPWIKEQEMIDYGYVRVLGYLEIMGNRQNNLDDCYQALKDTEEILYSEKKEAILKNIDIRIRTSRIKPTICILFIGKKK